LNQTGKTMRLFRALLPVVAITAGLWGQTADQPLTNSDIEAMLAAGLPESTILMKIEAAAFRGLVDLDASSSALIALKQKGASEPVLNAVVWAAPFGAVLKQMQAENRAVPGLPGAGGLYYTNGSGWVRLRSFLLWPSPYSGYLGWSAPFRRGHEFNVPLGGSQADLQITEARPAFYLRAPASQDWQIVRVTHHDNQRAIRFVTSSEFAGRDQFPAGEARKVQITRAFGEVFRLQPVASLESGEYALCSVAPGGPNLNVCYGFVVHR
jgi:hypothetical protein